MQVELLSDLDDNRTLRADLVIVGGGPAGLTVAQQVAGSGVRVLVVESGLAIEDADHAALNAVENVGELQTAEQMAKRTTFHGRNAKAWSPETQAFGVRCRALGGSTHAWSGKSAPFDEIDYRRRAWVDHSGWPFDRAHLDPFIDRAMAVLNLCPEVPGADFKDAGLRSFFWQFARSRIDGTDVMRFGAEILAQKPDGLRVLLDATVTAVGLDDNGAHFSHVEVASVHGKRARIEAPYCVLAASGIENPRLLLASRDRHPGGIGNAHDVVGRYLMDHPSAQVGEIPAVAMGQLSRRFGFYSVHRDGRTHLFMHGLAITPEVQEGEQLLNAAVYFTPMRAPDDPWDALRRLVRLRSRQPGRDLLSTVRGIGLLAKGVGMKVLTSDRTPKAFKDLVINTAIRLNPNLVADEFQDKGVPHKMFGLAIDAITEQIPHPDSRVMLSDQVDRFGVPVARVDWRINEVERQTLRRIATLTSAALNALGYATPTFQDWVADDAASEAVIIDMGHTLGTTRMATDPKEGVVDADCRVHGVAGLYVAGGSVFPTSGHANPTLMILAMAIRLADHLKTKLAQDKARSRQSGLKTKPVKE